MTHETSEEIDDAAAEWAARLDGAPLSPDEQLRLETWASADPRHQGALARAMAVLAHFDRAKALGPTFDPASHFTPRSRPAPKPGIGRRELIAGGAIAAGIGAAALLFPMAAATQVYVTRKGEVRSVPLADGSVIWLNTDTQLRVKYGHTRRSVTRVTGEALFDVAQDKARPCVIQAGDSDSRAVGTSFSVSRLDRQPVQVMVRDGMVEMASVHGHPVRLAAGMLGTATPSGPAQVSAPGADAVQRALSWRKGVLDFDGETLAQVAATFARYSDERIVIDDPDLARRSVTGLFSSTNPAGFAQAIAVSMNLKTRTEPGVIRLSR